MDINRVPEMMHHHRYAIEAERSAMTIHHPSSLVMIHRKTVIITQQRRQPESLAYSVWRLDYVVIGNCI